MENARQELRDTFRRQQGMIFKFIEKDGKFIHTLCDGELVYCLGFTSEQIVGKELADFLPMFDAAHKLQYYRKAWNGEDNVTYEGDRNGVWYLASLRPIRKGGRVVEVIGSCVDITERIKKEQEVSLLAKRLAEREVQYRLIADHSDDFIVLTDTHGMIRYASPSYERILGHSIAGREGHIGFRTIHPDDVLLAKRASDEVVRTKKSITMEFRILKSAGSFIWVEAIISPVLSPDGEVETVLVVSRDISERKQQEEKLRQSQNRYRNIAKRLADQEAKYRLIAENSQDLIGVLDRNGVVTYASPSHETVLGFPPHQVEGHSAFELVHPNDRANVATQYAHMVSSKTPNYVKFRYQHAEGHWVYVEANGTPVLNEQGEVEQFVVVARDLTETARAKTRKNFR